MHQIISRDKCILASNVTLLFFICILLHLPLLVQLLHNVLRHKYGVTTHLKLLQIRNVDLTIKFFYVMQYPYCEIVLAM